MSGKLPRLDALVGILLSLTLGACANNVDEQHASNERPQTPETPNEEGQWPPVPGGPLCASCQTSLDCGEIHDLCVVNETTGESFCGASCATGADCPDGFQCVDVPGAPENQCVPSSGSCTRAQEPSSPGGSGGASAGGGEAGSGGVAGSGGAPGGAGVGGSGGTAGSGSAGSGGTGSGGTGSVGSADACNGECDAQVLSACTCGGSDPCGWAGDNYCDSQCYDLYPANHFDDAQDCGSSGTGGSGGANSCNGECDAQVLTACTCSGVDPCGWAGDNYCDSQCYDLFPSDHFDDAQDCGSSGTGGTTGGGGSGGSTSPAGQTYGVTAVNDDLNNDDMNVIAQGLSNLGYSESVRDTNVSSSELAGYLAQPLSIFYHTGHGFEGAVATSSGSIYSDNVTLQADTTIFATCLTLQPSWASAFGPSAQRVMGYTKVSFDGLDDDIAQTFVSRLGAGRNPLQAWYEANVGYGMVNDRWAAYVREGGSIVEYSARSGHAPMSAIVTDWVPVGGHGLRVAQGVLSDESSYENRFEDTKMFSGAFSTLVPASSELRQLSAVSISEGAAAVTAETWLRARGQWPVDAVLDRIIPIERRTEQGGIPAAFVVRFARELDGLALRGNRVEHHISVVVDDSGVVSATKFWPELNAASDGMWKLRQLPLSWAVQLAAPQIAAMLKGDGLDVVTAEPAYGTEGHANVLTPAYALTSTDGSRIVVSAITGEVLR